MAPRDNRNIHDYFSWPGLITVGIGYGFYWLSERAGRNALELEKVPRIDLSDLKKKGKNELPCVASVTGRVSSETPLKCHNVPERGVIHRFITKEVFMKKNDRGDWKQDHKTVSDFTRETKWYLSGKCAKGAKLHVENGKSASGLELKIVYEGFDSGSGDGSKTALGALENILKAGSDMWNGMKSIGTLQKEGILPLGSTVTAVGQVSKSYVDKNDFVLQRPGKGGPFYITTKSMPELVQSLSRSSKRWWYLGLGFTSVGLFFFLRKVYLKLLESARLQKLRKDLEEYLDRKKRDGKEVPARDDLCVICMEKPYDCVFVKCGHMCCCLSCGEKCKKCPVCREVSKVKYVYKA